MSDDTATLDAAPGGWRDSDLLHDFRRSPVAIVAVVVTLGLLLLGAGASVIAPFDVTDPAVANVIDARLPPGATGLGGESFWLGTDPQGRDMVSAILYGLRMSLLVGLSSVAIAALAGIALGLVSGYFGGLIDAARTSPS